MASVYASERWLEELASDELLDFIVLYSDQMLPALAPLGSELINVY